VGVWKRQAFGNRMAWELPDLNTLAVIVGM
jgi:hypothetical protein